MPLCSSRQVDLITTLTKLSSLGQKINYEAYTYPKPKIDLGKLKLWEMLAGHLHRPCSGTRSSCTSGLRLLRSDLIRWRSCNGCSSAVRLFFSMAIRMVRIDIRFHCLVSFFVNLKVPDMIGRGEVFCKFSSCALYLWLCDHWITNWNKVQGISEALNVSDQKQGIRRPSACRSWLGISLFGTISI